VQQDKRGKGTETYAEQSEKNFFKIFREKGPVEDIACKDEGKTHQSEPDKEYYDLEYEILESLEIVHLNPLFNHTCFQHLIRAFYSFSLLSETTYYLYPSFASI